MNIKKNYDEIKILKVENGYIIYAMPMEPDALVVQEFVAMTPADVIEIIKPIINNLRETFTSK